jgi:hypothetical protein
MKLVSLVPIALTLGLAASRGAAQAPLIVHEWGTLTTQHAPDGTPRGRLNRIDASDVLPDFVHRFEPPQTLSNPFGKGPKVSGRPDVTMRLETPVIYFYAPDAATSEIRFDVRVQLRGGILNEFYPGAEPSVVHDMGRLQAKYTARVLGPADPIRLDHYLLGTLAWSGVTFDARAVVPATDSAVWTAPRNVAASRVRTGREAEHYLFYRGVAHLDSLIATSHTTRKVELRAPAVLHWMSDEAMTLSRIWLADVRPDGSTAFATRSNLRIEKTAHGAPLGEMPRFDAAAYGEAHAAALRQSMKDELVAAGLYDDEAEAMLATWNESYFRKPGLRLFYTVPRGWIDYFLPLELSVPHEATRVLVGRIDLLDHIDVRTVQSSGKNLSSRAFARYETPPVPPVPGL